MEDYNHHSPGFEQSHDASAFNRSITECEGAFDDGIGSWTETSHRADTIELHVEHSSTEYDESNFLYRGPSREAATQYPTEGGLYRSEDDVDQSNFRTHQRDGGPQAPYSLAFGPDGNTLHAAHDQTLPQYQHADTDWGYMDWGQAEQPSHFFWQHQPHVHVGEKHNATSAGQPDISGNDSYFTTQEWNNFAAYHSQSTLVPAKRHEQQPRRHSAASQAWPIMPTQPGALEHGSGIFSSSQVIQQDLTRVEEAPWSAEHQRVDDHRRGPTVTMDHLSRRVSTADTSHTSATGDNTTESRTTYSLTSEVQHDQDKVWGYSSEATICPGGTAHVFQKDGSRRSQLSSTYDERDRIQGEPVSTGFRWAIRESTPGGTEGIPLEAQQISSLTSQFNENLLLASHSSLSSSGPPSPFNSTAPNTVRCDLCLVEFHGRYCRGNQARHFRNKHRGDPRIFECEDDNCDKVFQRDDARLKHYRRRHVHLSTGPAVPRKDH